jgi:hypothetical protein
MPEGSSIVTATVRCSESNSSLNPIVLDHKLLGGEGKVIRMTQLSPDSWILLGYRYDDGVSGACSREGRTLLNTDWTSSPLSDAASDDTNHPDDGGDEEDQNGEEGPGEYRPHAAGSDPRFSKDDMHFRQRTRIPWKESDDVRLLLLRDN